MCVGYLLLKYLKSEKCANIEHNLFLPVFSSHLTTSVSMTMSAATFLVFLFQISAAFNPDLSTLSIDRIIDAIRNGTSCVSITRYFLDRIDQFDHHGPNIHAVIMKNQYAIDEAKLMDSYFARTGALKGTLHCVPTLIKDAYMVKDLNFTLGKESQLNDIAAQWYPFWCDLTVG